MTKNEELAIQKEVEALEKETGAMLNEYNAYKVTTPEEFIGTGAILKRIKGKYAVLDDREKEITRPLEAAKKSVIALFKRPKAILDQLEAKIKQAMLTFEEKQEAERKAKEEQLRKEQEAEAKKLAAKAAKTKDEDKKAELLAQAEATRNAAPIVATEAVKVDGISTVTNWGFEIVDQAKIPLEYQMPDEVKIGKVVRATQGTVAIPGVRIYSYKSIKSGKV